MGKTEKIKKLLELLSKMCSRNFLQNLNFVTKENTNLF